MHSPRNFCAPLQQGVKIKSALGRATSQPSKSSLNQTMLSIKIASFNDKSRIPSSVLDGASGIGVSGIVDSSNNQTIA